jgi:DNA-binding LacI/PurR family transcriptional regulator
MSPTRPKGHAKSKGTAASAALTPNEVAGKPPRLVDVARRANVSHVTVSHVLMGTGKRVRVSDETAQRVRKIAREMNYRPNHAARQLRGKRSCITGLLLSGVGDVGQARILAGAEQLLEPRGQLAVVGHTRDRTDLRAKYLKEFAARNVDAVICLTVAPEDTEADLAQLLNVFPKTVFYDCSWKLPAGAVAVDVSRAAPARLGVEHLVERGRQRIGLVLWGDTQADRSRRRGFREGLEAAGRAYDAALEFNYDGLDRGRPPIDAIEEAIDRLVIEQKADAIVAYDDLWGVGLVRSLLRRGFRVPGDVAVVGAENLPASSVVDPELTTVDPRYYTVGQELARISMAFVEQPDDEAPPVERVVITPKLVVRGSS